LAVNLSVDAELLAVAKQMKLNLSSTLEATLRKVTEEERIRRWRAENKHVVDSYNAYIERNGILGEELLDLDEPPV
jgi:antitoxin CcdA